MLAEKGGRGFPYCAIMDAKGEVLWEVRPTSREAFMEGLGHAQRLDGLRKQLAKNPKDAVLAANVALLDALGRSQRPGPDLAELEKHAAVKGVDAEILKKFEEYKAARRITDAMSKAREDGGKAVYDLMVAGVEPGDDGSAIGFYYYAARGAIAAKDAAWATKAVDKFEEEGSKNERFKERAMKDAAKMREEIEALDTK